MIVAYDIASDKRRLKISDLLESYGNRVNYSVFECLVTAKEAGLLTSALSGLIKPGKDNVVIYFLCKSCIGKTIKIPENDKQIRLVNLL